MQHFDEVQIATTAIQQRSSLRPSLALILGSGSGDLADEIEDACIIPYSEIPHFAHATIAGHAGRLLLGTLEKVPVIAMQGRFHLYEGYSPQTITLPVRVMHQLGAHTLLVSNAAGGLNPSYQPGDFMLIRDHIFLAGMTGNNPLHALHDPRLGNRFPAMTHAYDVALRNQLRFAAQSVPDITLHEGIYIMVAGPSYETPAELRFLRTLGADTVGMSTAPEVVVARQIGMRVAGISLITNSATGNEPLETTSHAEVLAAGNAARPRFAALIQNFIRHWR